MSLNEATPNSAGEPGSPPGDTITIKAPNGLPTKVAYHPHQKVKVVLAAAVKIFAESETLDPSIPYDLVKSGTVLSAEESLEDSGIHPGDVLNIRARAIPVDGACIWS